MVDLMAVETSLSCCTAPWGFYRRNRRPKHFVIRGVISRPFLLGVKLVLSAALYKTLRG